MVCSLVGGPPGAIASAGPLILGTRWGGAERRVGHCTWHQSMAPPWETTPILSPFPFLSSYLQMNPAASLPPTFLGSLPLPYAFSTFSQTLHRPAALYSQPAPSPLGAREPLPISHQLLWLKQGGQSPLDPKGAPMYRDMSKPWVKLGRFG